MNAKTKTQALTVTLWPDGQHWGVKGDGDGSQESAKRAMDALALAHGLPTYSEALKALSLLSDDLEHTLPALRRAGAVLDKVPGGGN